MFDNVALDVVIGLVFIYLLYSLFATIIAEIVATQIGLRAYNLKEAIDRMLNDEDANERNWFQRLIDSLNIWKNPNNLMVKNFYNHPEIKYLGSTGVFKTPSFFKAVSFSKTILNCLCDGNASDKFKIEQRLRELSGEITSPLDAGQIILDKETAKYVLSLWDESYGDVVKFKLHLETWFNRTMDQCLEWYKRKIQFILMIIGFLMAWFFNADTFTIIHKLSTDDKAREQMVSMANAYVENNKGRILDTTALNGVSSADIKEYNAKLDSLLEVKKKLDEDIANANSVLGLGGWLPDTVTVNIDSAGNKKINDRRVEMKILMQVKSISTKLENIANGKKIGFTPGEKRAYFFWLPLYHFFGFLITAIAISLGAPFWFDLLNKLMKLRTSKKEPTNSVTADNTVSPLNREA